MALDVSIFTSNGVNLLSAASATKTIDIDHIYCLETELTEAEIRTQPKEYFANLASNRLVGKVVSAGDDPNNPGRSRVVVSIELEDGIYENVTLKSLVVTAHAVDAGLEGDEGTFFGMSDHNGLVIVYSTSIPMKQNIGFSFAFTRESTIAVNGDLTNYLLESEIGRFVTTHNPGDVTAGENQFIRGVKNFADGIGTSELSGFNGSITLHDDIIPYRSGIDVGSEDDPLAYVYAYTAATDVIEAITTSTVNAIAHIVPTTDETYTLGADEHLWKEVWAKEIHANVIHATGSNSSLGSDDNIFSSFHAWAGYTNSLRGISTQQITIASRLIPDGDGTRSLGVLGQRWGTLWCLGVRASDTVYARTVDVTTSIKARQIEAKTSDASIGTIADPFHDVITNRVMADDIFCPTNTDSIYTAGRLGTPYYLWDAVYTSNIDCARAVVCGAISCDIDGGHESTKQVSSEKITIITTNSLGYAEIRPLSSIGTGGTIPEGNHVDNKELSNKLYGSGYCEVPIGGLVLAIPSPEWIQAHNTPEQGSYEVTFVAGATVQIHQSNAGQTWFSAALRPTAADGSYFYNGAYNRTLVTGIYRLLHTLEIPANFTGSFTLPVLLQRIS